jgi:glucokinase
MKQAYVLAADVGGTKAAVALASAGAAGRPQIVAQHIYACREFEGLQPILENFLQQPLVAGHRGAITAACIAVAGPVASNHATLTNLGWKIDGNALAVKLRLPEVRLLNDFAAAGRGINQLGPGEIETLQAGSSVAHAARIIIGAGTGLGVGLLTWQGDGYTVYPSEAGHADFAPVDELQDQLLAYLRRSFGRVSYERVVSGPGLMRIFSFLQETGAGMPSKPLQEASIPWRCARSTSSSRSTVRLPETWHSPCSRTAGFSSPAASRPRSSASSRTARSCGLSTTRGGSARCSPASRCTS